MWADDNWLQEHAGKTLEKKDNNEDEESEESGTKRAADVDKVKKTAMRLKYREQKDRLMLTTNKTNTRLKIKSQQQRQ